MAQRLRIRRPPGLLLLAFSVAPAVGQTTPEKTATEGPPPYKLLALRELLQEATGKTDPAEKRALFDEYLASSEALLKQFPDTFELWRFRAIVALQVDAPKVGWDAGRHLKSLGAERSADEGVQRLLALMERRHWLQDALPTDQASQGPSDAPRSPSASPAPTLSAADRRKLDVVMLIAADADKATAAVDRKRFLREFLASSSDLAATHHGLVDLWAARAMAAIELDYGGIGFFAGRQLKVLKQPQSEQANVRQAMARLERKNWLGNERLWRDWSKTTLDLVRRDADGGDLEAQAAFGDWFYRGKSDLKQDFAEAARWFRMAAESGDVSSMYSLGLMYESGLGVVKGDAESARWYRKAADAGHVDGMNNVGVTYALGRGFPKDDAEAARWFRKAADGGSNSGMKNLGVMYDRGLGVAKDEAEAARWYRKAADAGEAIGMRNLGMMYETGRGVAKDDWAAVHWYHKAADAGQADGMNNLAAMYELGQGVAKEELEAVRWYRKAADAGATKGMYNLGRMHESGRGTAKDEAEAARWYRKAADAGMALAMKDLGRMYENGRGVAKDLAEANLWYRKAAETGEGGDEKNAKAGEVYRAENARKPGVKTLASGLQIEMLIEGAGDVPTATDIVRVNYNGKLIDGTQFDSGTAGRAPMEFPLNHTIAGWSESLQQMKVGSKARVVIPGSLAYGSSGGPPSIPPNATLVFEIELLAIKK